jgi:hypothetical protein
MPEELTNLETTEVVSPDGEVGTVPTSTLSDALETGYRIPTSDEHIAAAEKEQYAQRPKAAAAVGAIKSVAPFGIGMAGLRATGVAPETLEKLQQYNPGATTAGEVAGVLVPSPIGIGKLASVAGKTVASAVEGVAAKAAGKILSKAAGKIVGGGVEGALFGGSNVLNESVISDNPSQVAENALSEVGMSALWGGTLGGALHFGEVAIPPILAKAREAANTTSASLGVSSVAQRVAGAAKEGYASAASVISGKPKEDILAAIMNRGTDAKPLDAEEITKNLQQHVDALEKAKTTAIKDIRPEETEQLTMGADPIKVQQVASDTYNSLDNAIKTMRTEPELYPGNYPRQLELIRDSIPRTINSESAPADVFDALNGLKQQLDTKIPYERVPSVTSQNAISLIKDLRGGIKQSLEDESVWGQAGARQAQFNNALSDYLKSANLPRQKGEFVKQFMYKGAGGVLKVDPSKVETFLKNVQSSKGIKSASALSNFVDSSNTLLDQIESTYKSLPDKEFDKQALKDFIDRNQAVIERNQQQAQLNRLAKGASAEGSGMEPFVAGALAHTVGLSHPLVGALVAGAEALRYPGQFINRLTKLEEAFHSAQQKIVRGARALAGPAGRLADYTKGYTASRLAVSNKAKYEKITDQVKELATNPVTAIDKFHASVEGLESHAPRTAAAMQQAGSRAISFLMSKIPQPQQGPLAPPPEPSNAQIGIFGHYYRAVEDPLSVLKDAASGTLTHAGVETLMAVYPTLYDNIKTTILSELSDKKDPSALPYRRRLMLSLLLGQDVDGSTSPMSIQANQSMLSVSAAQTQAKDAAMAGANKPRAAGLDKLSISNRALTAQQQSSQRAQES